MTVTTSTNQVIYRGDGVTTVLPFTFTVINVEDLVVTGRYVPTQVVDTFYVLDVDYTAVTNYPDAGGSITTTLGPGPVDSTYDTIITRTVDYTQELDIINEGGFFPRTLQTQLDKTVMMVQQLEARLAALEV